MCDNTSYYCLRGHTSWLHDDAIPQQFFTPLANCTFCRRNDWTIKCASCNETTRCCCIGLVLYKVQQEMQSISIPHSFNCHICRDLEMHSTDETMMYCSPAVEPGPSGAYQLARFRQRKLRDLLPVSTDPAFPWLPPQFFAPLAQCGHCRKNDWVLKCACCNATTRCCCMGCVFDNLEPSMKGILGPQSFNCPICRQGSTLHIEDRTAFYGSHDSEPRPSQSYVLRRLQEARRLCRALRSYNMLVRRTKKACRRTLRFHHKRTLRRLCQVDPVQCWTACQSSFFVSILMKCILTVGLVIIWLYSQRILRPLRKSTNNM